MAQPIVKSQREDCEQSKFFKPSHWRAKLTFSVGTRGRSWLGANQKFGSLGMASSELKQVHAIKKSERKKYNNWIVLSQSHY